ncbi:MAG: hypothetical protein PHF86_07200 [Candidatus Nanoarchaeia archaeon]|jgi:hypothetical protein|nr:hypothetical protein [Candidatus Nanoarchaeia archaeon]
MCLKDFKIDNKTKTKIKEVKNYASSNILTEHDLLAIKEGLITTPERTQEHIIEIYQDFKIIFTVEQINNQLYNHLIISRKNSCPNIHEAIIIMSYFDMGNNINNLDDVWINKKLQVNLLSKKTF